MDTIIDPSSYKLIAFDIDGTLVGSSRTLTTYTKSVLARLRQKGPSYTLTTGRNLLGVRPYANELEVDLPMVLSNGSILQTRQGKLIHQIFLPLEAVRAAIQTSHARNCDLVMYIGAEIYLSQLNENTDKAYGSVKSGLHIIEDWESISDKWDQANKCLFVDTENEQNLIDIEPILQRALDGHATTLRARPDLLEVQPNGATKATALQRLADMLNIRMKEIIAFGDYYNDVEMLKAAGLGIAVENAVPACQESADLLIASVDVDGPAHFLEELFL